MKNYNTGGEDFQQRLENLPNELLEQPRWFPVLPNKHPLIKDWSNPDNQKFVGELPQDNLLGFDTTGHDIAPDYSLIDFDHVLNAAGNFVNPDAEKWYNLIVAKLGSDCFVERSISGHGLHIPIKPTPGKFDAIANGKDGVLYFDKETNCKVELFYKTRARYCLFTGDLYHCQPAAPIGAGDKADAVLQLILDEIKARQPKPSPARATDKKLLPQAAQFDSPEYNLFRAEHMLDAINPADLADSDWLAVTSACKNIGVPYSVVDSFNQRDLNRYNAEENRTRYDSLDDSSFDIATLHGIAKRFGYDEKETCREFYRLHPERATKRARAALDAFDKEKDAALEKLRDVEKFDSSTVFNPDIITAAAFARNFDQKEFSNFKREIINYGNKHKNEKVSVNNWLAAVKDKAAELQTQRADLVSQKNEIDAKIKSQKFFANNSSLTNFESPVGYAISVEHGIEKVSGEYPVTVCRRPVIIKSKSFDFDEKIYKLTLAYMTTEGKWKSIPPTEAAHIFDKNKLVTLANHGLPVTSANAFLLVDFLDALKNQNDNVLPIEYIVPRCGWYNFEGIDGKKDYFVDPRRPVEFQSKEGKNISVKVDEGRSDFAKHLKGVGSLEKWKDVYMRAKKSPVARAVVAAAVAPILNKILGERNFLLYICAPTRAGKTTALYLAASAIGDEKIIRSFDATKNGLAGAAADVNDYPFFIDEKQVADNRLKEAFDNLVYALANGIGRTKLNRDSTLKKLHDWRTIAIMTGETQMLPDNATGGAFTRLLTVNAPKVILPDDDCRIIHDTIPKNHGLVFPRVIDKVKTFDEEKMRGGYRELVEFFTKTYPALLPEYCRYMAIITLADTLLNSALFGNTVTTDDVKTLIELDDATLFAKQIFKLIPTRTEIDDTPREKEFVLEFIAQNQPNFIHGPKKTEYMQAIFGKLKDDDGYSYITTRALKDACARGGFDYRKLVADLVADQFFIPADTIEKGRKAPRETVQKQIGETYTRCYRFKNSFLNKKEDGVITGNSMMAE